MKQKFHCIPGSILMSILFALYAIGFVWAAFLPYWTDPVGGFWLSMFLAALATALALTTGFATSRRVELHCDRLICKGLLPRNTFSMSYADCDNIGMDSHVQFGRQVWWIYLCQGRLPYRKSKGSANGINSAKIQPGFIRIVYSDEVYEALLNVLPKPQKERLISAHRFAGFEVP